MDAGKNANYPEPWGWTRAQFKGWAGCSWTSKLLGWICSALRLFSYRRPMHHHRQTLSLNVLCIQKKWVWLCKCVGRVSEYMWLCQVLLCGCVLEDSLGMILHFFLFIVGHVGPSVLKSYITSLCRFSNNCLIFNFGQIHMIFLLLLQAQNNLRLCCTAATLHAGRGNKYDR